MKEQILEFVAKYRKEKGYAPEQKEIAEALDVTKQNVNYHFHRMKKELSKYPEYKKLFDTVKE